MGLAQTGCGAVLLSSLFVRNFPSVSVFSFQGAVAACLTAGILMLSDHSALAASVSASTCRLGVPPASRNFVTGCSCSGTTLVATFTAGPAFSLPNHAACMSAVPPPASQASSNPNRDAARSSAAEAARYQTLDMRNSSTGRWTETVPDWEYNNQTGRFNQKWQRYKNRRPVRRLQNRLSELEAKLASQNRELQQLVSEREKTKKYVNILGDLIARFDETADKKVREKQAEVQRTKVEIFRTKQKIRELEIQLENGLSFRPVNTAQIDRAFVALQDNRTLKDGAQADAISVSLAYLRGRRARVAPEKGGFDPVAQGDGLGGLLLDPRFNLWLDGRFSFNRDDRRGGESDGTGYRLTAGASYRVHHRVNLGLQGRFEETGSDRDNGTSSFDTEAFGGSVFAQVRLLDGLTLTPLFAFRRANSLLVETSNGRMATSRFNSHTWTLGGEVSKRFTFDGPGQAGRLWVEPALSVSHVFSDRGSYIRSDGVSVPGAGLETGSVSFGPTIGMNLADPFPNISRIAPSLSVNGTWTYLTTGEQILANGARLETQGAWAGITGDLSIRLQNGVSSRLSAGVDGLGSDVLSGRIGGRLTIPLGGS